MVHDNLQSRISYLKTGQIYTKVTKHKRKKVREAGHSLLFLTCPTAALGQHKLQKKRVLTLHSRISQIGSVFLYIIKITLQYRSGVQEIIFNIQLKYYFTL